MIVKNRDAGIDLARIVGIIAIVAGHVWIGVDLVYDAIYPWHVPLFFFLTGYLWRSWRPFRDEVKARSLTLALPYLTWFTVLSVPFFVAIAITRSNDLSGIILDSLLGGSYAGRPYSAFWFVGALFAVTILYRIMQRLPFWSHVAIAAGLLIVSYFIADALIRVPLGFGLALPALIFVVAGRAWRVHCHRLGHKAWWAVGALIGCLALVATGVSAPIDFKPGNLGTPVLTVAVGIVLSASVLELCRTVASVIPKAEGVITTLGSTGFTVILAHGGVLWLLRTTDVGGLGDFLVALSIPWLVGVVALRTRLSRLITGAPRRLAVVPHKAALRTSGGGSWGEAAGGEEHS